MIYVSAPWCASHTKYNASRFFRVLARSLYEKSTAGPALKGIRPAQCIHTGPLPGRRSPKMKKARGAPRAIWHHWSK